MSQTPSTNIAKPLGNTCPQGVFRAVLEDIKENSEHLPSIPSVCLRVRKALSNPNTNVNELVKLISRDPALSSFLIKAGASPAYYTSQPNPSLEQVIRLLGFETINNLTMLHSVKSLFFNQHARLKPLCNYTWRMLAIKAGIATLIAKKAKFQPVDHAMLGAIYTELGALAILSALRSVKVIPDLPSFIVMSRSYGISISTLILKKWRTDAEFIQSVKHLGDWRFSEADQLALTDVVNLAHFHGQALLSRGHYKLPELYDVSAYYKLPKDLAHLNPQGLLTEIVDDKVTLARLANTFL